MVLSVQTWYTKPERMLKSVTLAGLYCSISSVDSTKQMVHVVCSECDDVYQTRIGYLISKGVSYLIDSQNQIDQSIFPTRDLLCKSTSNNLRPNTNHDSSERGNRSTIGRISTSLVTPLLKRLANRKPPSDSVDLSRSRSRKVTVKRRPSNGGIGRDREPGPDHTGREEIPIVGLPCLTALCGLSSNGSA